MFQFKKPTQINKPKEGCKIKIKNTAQGKQIEFSGNCSKEQIDMAKTHIMDDSEEE